MSGFNPNSLPNRGPKLKEVRSREVREVVGYRREFWWERWNRKFGTDVPPGLRIKRGL